MAPLYGLVGPIWLGYTMPFWKPEDVIHSATPEKALTIVDDFQPDYLTAVPTFLEVMTERVSVVHADAYNLLF